MSSSSQVRVTIAQQVGHETLVSEDMGSVRSYNTRRQVVRCG